MHWAWNVLVLKSLKHTDCVVAIAHERDQDEQQDHFDADANGDPDHPAVVFPAGVVALVDQVDDGKNQGKDCEAGAEGVQSDVLKNEEVDLEGCDLRPRALRVS
jgi:hypothetical protein